jgi:hypothetical protein
VTFGVLEFWWQTSLATKSQKHKSEKMQELIKNLFYLIA